jgi:phosphoglycerate dehydrogenase-like enzyme
MTAPIRLMLADGGARRFATRIRDCQDSKAFELIVPENDALANQLAAAPQADAILCYQAQLPAAVIDAARSLKFIQKHGVMCRNIDVAAATARKIPVATIALMRSVTVAEHALTMMLACARKVTVGHAAVTQGVYRDMGLEPIATSQRNYKPNWPKIQGVTELFKAAVGIIGMGDIGMEIAKRCRAFDMKVCYYDLARHDAAFEAARGLHYLPFDDLLAECDFIVTIVPHTPQTEGMIGEKQLALMKPSAIFVNVGRGGLVDEAALVAALQAKRIAMAGLDVYRNEPLPFDSPLIKLPNVVLTPHNGGGSYRSWEVDTPASLGNIRKFFAGETVEGIVNA